MTFETKPRSHNKESTTKRKKKKKTKVAGIHLQHTHTHNADTNIPYHTRQYKYIHGYFCV